MNFWGEMTKSWMVQLTCGAETLGEVPIKRVVFQGNVLCLLLFEITLIPLIHTLRIANPGYEF